MDFPTRIDHTLDLILTNIPDKVVDIHGFEDIINTDHKLINFTLDFNIRKIPVTKRYVYNYKLVNWNVLNESLMNVPWDMAFVYNDIDASLANWCDLFLSTVSDHVPKRRVMNTHDHPWLDDELLKAIKHKNRCRKKALKTRNLSDISKFKEIRRKTKQLMLLKKKDHARKLKVSLGTNPKRFWALVKASTTKHPSSNFLRDGQSIVTDSVTKASLLNRYFHSVFTTPAQDNCAPVQTSSNHQLREIEISVTEVCELLSNLVVDQTVFLRGYLNAQQQQYHQAYVVYSIYHLCLPLCPRIGKRQI